MRRTKSVAIVTMAETTGHYPSASSYVQLRDPRYITHGDDKDRGDILLTLAQVRELILTKQLAEEGVATIWLTTADMGFPLTVS
jgi:hypothetical protein